MKPKRVFYYRGQIEVAMPRNGRPGYRWANGYSEDMAAPWRTKTQIQAQARCEGFRAIFANKNTVQAHQKESDETPLQESAQKKQE